jgi:hypothetical protein
VSRQDTKADHSHKEAATRIRRQMDCGRPTAIFILFLGLTCVAFLVGWFQRGAEIRDIETANRRLAGRLRLAEFEKRGLRETIGPLIGRAYVEFPGEETTRAVKKVAARLEWRDALARPITSVLAAVEVVVASDLGVDKHDAAGSGYLSLCRGSDTLLVISSDSFCARRSKDGDVEYGGVFQMSPRDSASGTPLDLLGETEYMTIGFDLAPDDDLVRGGKVTIIFNTSKSFEFQIPSQQVQDNKVFIRGIGSSIESQIRSKTQVPIPAAPGRSASDAPDIEQVRKAVGAHFPYASTAEVRGPLSIQQVEEEMLRSTLESYVIEGIRRDIALDPFRSIDSRWQHFKSQLLVGVDQIYYFISDKDSWAILCGCAGYVIIREGQVVDVYITSGN